jgi:polysaccharide biosynthesis/export protein
MKYCSALIFGLALLLVAMPFNLAQSVQTGTIADASANTDPLPTQSMSLRIGSGDLLEMAVFNVPEMSQRQRVDENGNYSVPLVGPVHLGGLTLQEAQNLIASKLDDEHYVREPSVSLFISDFATQGVSVMGEVVKPGVYPVWGERRLLDMIAAAGGVTARAGKIASISHRNNPAAPQNALFTEGGAQDPDTNPLVAPGDTIIISKSGIVYVLGDVVRPGGFPMENDQTLTLMKAVALAQGTSRTAKLGSARLVRNTITGRQEMPVNLKAVMKGRSPDLVLQADDILYVPSSLAKTLADRTLPGIVAATSTAVIYTQIR